MRRRVRGETGSALIATMVLIAVGMMIGLAVAATSQVQLTQTRQERVRDSSFELAEGTLYAQGFLLPSNWPGTAARAFPTSCSSASATTPLCPDRDTLAAANAAGTGSANFDTSDYQSAYGQTCPTSVTAGNDVTCWVTEIRDDGGALCRTFSAAAADQTQTTAAQTACPGAPPTSCAGPCAWDANGNKTVWAYARAFVHGKARAVAAKLKLETLNEGLASAGFRVGRFSTGNKGAKTIVDAAGAQVLVNCDPADTTSCVMVGKADQVTPAPTQMSGSNVFMSPQQLAHFAATAKADGHYYTGCPPNNDLSGKVVWVDNCNASVNNSAPSVSCSVPLQNTKKCFNTPVGQDPGCTSCPGALGGAGPGLLIWHSGTLSLGGNAIYVGTIYMPNGSDQNWQGTSSGTLLSIGGTAAIYGSLAIDGDGAAAIGESKENFEYDSNSAGVFKSYGTAGLVQNTWQELPPSGG